MTTAFDAVPALTATAVATYVMATLNLAFHSWRRERQSCSDRGRPGNRTTGYDTMRVRERSSTPVSDLEQHSPELPSPMDMAA